MLARWQYPPCFLCGAPSVNEIQIGMDFEPCCELHARALTVDAPVWQPGEAS